MTTAIKLRAAIPADAATLRGWEGRPHLVESGITGDWQWETEIPRKPDWREQLIAELEGRVIGYVEIIDPSREDSHYWGEVEPNLRAIDIWIGEPDCLGRGFGSDMMRQALERCFADPTVEAVLIDPLASNLRAHRFYRRHGFVEVGPRQFDDDECLVMRLAREDWKRLGS